MPGPAMHHLIVNRLRAGIQSNTGLGNLPQPDYVKLQSLLADPRNLPYIFLGCQGPDFFFFNAKDVHPSIGKLVEMYYDVYDFIEHFKRTLLAAVPQPILDALAAYDEAKNEIIQDSALLSELQETFDDINRVLNAFMPTLLEMVKKFVSEFNVFSIIEHPYRDGESPGSWWWFDAMHYRKTGRYAAALLEATRDRGSPLHLYALGYLTHVAADTVGHPYVNIFSGGPYRSQSQRHKTGENFQDVFNFLSVNGQDWNYSKLHAFYNFNFSGTITDQEPDPFTHMPGDLAELIANTLNEVFKEGAGQDGLYAATITPGDVDDTYRTWYRWFKNATDTGTLPPPVPYSFTGELREVWDKTVDNLEDAGDFLKNAVDSTSSLGVLSILLILAAAIVAAVMAAAALADGIAGSVATMGTATIRYAASLIYEQLYDAFQNFRLGVALNGLAFPMREHLTEPRFQQFINPVIPDSTGVSAARFTGGLPRLWAGRPSDPLATLFSMERHLFYPLTDLEKEAALPGPPTYFFTLPTYYAFGNIPLSSGLLDQLTSLSSAEHRSEPELKAIIQRETLGNALDLSRALYERWFQGIPLPDFNLDADRGYGYLCWSQVRGGSPDPVNAPTELDTNPTVSLKFIP